MYSQNKLYKSFTVLMFITFLSLIYMCEAEESKNIYIYYDSSYRNSWLSITDSDTLAKFVPETLAKYGISCEIVDAKQLAEIVSHLEDASNTVILMAMDVAPDTVWTGARDSPIQLWIEAGGTLIWTGDWEFYYIGFSNYTNVHQSYIENIVFGMITVTAFADNTEVKSTELGRRIMPSFEGYVTDRPAYASIAETFECEIYGLSDDGVYAEPVLIKLGMGAIVKICMTGGDVDSTTRATLICEFILNRVFNMGGVKIEKPFPTIPIVIGVAITIAAVALIVYLMRRR
ncbi:hypothetical protein KEJ27_07825 [Candidatus Bathyarchaeota archaeon]|nr:hypothetical protein [Candidatus Bathyarchaeota archaeon]